MSESPSTDHTEKLNRIREAAMTAREPRNAGKIADIADVARNTAEKYLHQLVAADKLMIVEQGRERCYYPDPVTQYFDHVRDLIENQTKDELTGELVAIQDEIDAWKDEYDVSSADELRTTVDEADLSTDERRQRIQIAEDWEYYRHQASLIKQALHLYDPIETARTTRPAPP